MKFCKYCGTQLDDNEICKCDDSKKALTQSFANTTPYDSVGTLQKDKVQEIVDAFRAFPELYIGAWKNPKRTMQIAVKNNEHIICSFCAALYFISTLLFNLFFFLHIKSWISKKLGDIDSLFGISDGMFSFPKVLLTALIMTVILFAGNTFATYGIMKCKKAKTRIGNHFIGVSVYSLPSTTLLFVASLLALLHPIAGLFVAIVSVVYLLVSNLLNEALKCGDTDDVKSLYINTVIISVFVLIIIYAFTETFIWNVNFLS